MRNKKAKAFRKIAEEATVGQPKVEYVSVPFPKVQTKYIAHMPIMLSNHCTRFFYKQLKKAA